MNQQMTEQLTSILKENLIKSGIRCAFVFGRNGETKVKVHEGAQASKELSESIPMMTDLLMASKSASDLLAQLVGEKAEFSLLLHQGEKRSIWVNRLTEELLLGTLYQNEVPIGVLRMQIRKTVGNIQKIFAAAQEDLIGRRVEVIVNRIMKIHEKTFAECRTNRMHNVRLLLPENHKVSVGDFVFGRILRSRSGVYLGLLS